MEPVSGVGSFLDVNLDNERKNRRYNRERFRQWCLRRWGIKQWLLNLFIVPITICWAATSQAYPTYSQNSDTNTGYCADCHGDFNGSNYSSLTTDDPANWGMNLMKGHVTRYEMQCTDCHDNVAKAPVATNSSISGVTCATCHGRDEDNTPNDGTFGGSAAGRGDGLRARHEQAGITVCSNCHTADTTPVGENVAPVTYVAKGIDPCDENDYGSVRFGSAGLDNDGDGLRDGDDPDCGSRINNPPIVTDDFAVTQQDTQATIDVLTNDSDPDGNGISINSYDTTSAFGGSVVCDTTGGICTYIPALGFTGDDTFTYDITDGMAVSDNRATVTITVEPPVNQPPSCSGVTPTTGQVGTAMNFNANASDPNGDTLSYSWDFGDGSSSTLPAPSHTYSSAGDYTVSLMVDDNNGGTATCMATVTVSVASPVNQNPTCSAITPTMGEQNTVITFSATASDPDGDPLTYSWDFGDGSTSTQASPSHTYVNTGDYTVTLTVSDGRGGTSSCSATVSISAPAPENQPPVCSNIAPTTGNTNVALSFSADAIDPDGDPLTYNWDFGDGNTSTQVNPSHTYSSAGIYTVSLTVSDGNGGASSCSTSVTITAPPPASG
jgi:PKD repeat protein/cytochrome c553